MRRRLLPALVALLAWATAACQVTLTAGVDVNRDGTGRVVAGLGLDDDALKEVGDPATALRLDDVRAAGWQVDPPRKEGDGLTWIRAAKAFTDPEQVPAIVAELNGPDGPFRGFRVERTKSLTRSKTTFTGTVDLANGLTGLADSDLTAALADVDLGLDPDGLRARFGQQLTVHATAGLPGDLETNAPARDGRRALWTPDLGQTIQMEASSEALRIEPRLLAFAGAPLLLAVVLLAVLVRRRRRGRTGS
jgi:predicted small secreted protein